MPLPVRWRYKLDRWRSQIAEMFHSEPKQLRPRLCPACGTLVGATANQVPSVRREHDVFLCRRQQVPQPLDAADFAGDLRDAGDLLRDVCAVVCHHDEIVGGRRRGRRSDEHGRNRHSG